MYEVPEASATLPEGRTILATASRARIPSPKIDKYFFIDNVLLVLRFLPFAVSTALVSGSVFSMSVLLLHE